MNDEELIWNLLMNGVGNPYGVAGLMGNLFAESSLNPMCKTGGHDLARNCFAEEYVYFIDSEQMPGDIFSTDEVAFGLAQWRYYSRKEQMYDYWKEYNDKNGKTSIADITFQISFLLKEIKTYKTVWDTLINTRSVKAASDIVMERYEKPGNISDKAKEKRAQFGQEYFDKYASVPTPEPDIPSGGPVRVRTTMKNVNVRRGNGKKYGVITQSPNPGTSFDYVTKVGDWYAVEVVTGKQRQVGWISTDCAEVI